MISFLAHFAYSAFSLDDASISFLLWCYPSRTSCGVEATTAIERRRDAATGMAHGRRSIHHTDIEVCAGSGYVRPPVDAEHSEIDSRWWFACIGAASMPQAFPSPAVHPPRLLSVIPPAKVQLIAWVSAMISMSDDHIR
ncbi:hypothetical protein GQ55_5G389200 [Panicum hallii var. hallii]|uniref:Uncharacterized protein n=1 Tax=Panicum hallii var. hallii TaxID=1504633 RepID=A0A2T7DMZ6_9POAL|nr:hypothetical protein GQ55_5G389200 [Panicum hallii var. hallii]